MACNLLTDDSRPNPPTEWPYVSGESETWGAFSGLESAFQTNVPNLNAYSDRTVLIDDNRTPDDPADDLVGKSRLRLYSFSNAGNHTEINKARSQEFIIAQSEITWKSMGRDRQVVFTSHLAP